MRILWVENHQRFVAAVRLQFLAAHELTVVPSLAAARVAAFGGGAPAFDAALVDFDLDDGKGDALVREMRERFPGLPIVATSAHGDGNQALTAAGADAVCGKMEFRRIPQLLESLAQSRRG